MAATNVPPLTAEHFCLADWVRDNCQSKSAARSLPDIAQAVGISQRKCQTIKAELLAHGVVICSSCGKPSGWYWPADAAEIAPYARQLEHRVMANARSLETMYRMHPALRPVVLRVPPLRYAAEGDNVTAQSALFAEPGVKQQK